MTILFAGLNIAFVVVLLVALILAYFLIKNNRSKKTDNKVESQSLKSETISESVIKDADGMSDDEKAAIFLALHMYLSGTAHDIESNVITIQRIQRRYSPWSSKIYSMNNFQR